MIGKLTNTGNSRIGLDLAQEGSKNLKSDKNFLEIMKKENGSPKDSNQSQTSIQNTKGSQLKDKNLRANAKEKSDDNLQAPEKVQNKKVESSTVERKDEPSKGVLNKRQKAIQKFMDSAESEFSIPPTGVLEAMAKMSPSELSADAKSTASAVVSDVAQNYGLDSAQQAKLLNLYNEMLTTGFNQDASDSLASVNANDPMNGMNSGLSSSDLAALGLYELSNVNKMNNPSDTDQMKGLKLGANAPIDNQKADNSKPIVSSSLERRKAINDSLDKMNSSFFINGLAKDSIAVPEGLNIESVVYNPSETAGLAQRGSDLANSPMGNLTPKSTDDLLNALSFLEDSLDDIISESSNLGETQSYGDLAQLDVGNQNNPNNVINQMPGMEQNLTQQQSQSYSQQFQQQFAQGDGQQSEGSMKDSQFAKMASSNKEKSAAKLDDFFNIPIDGREQTLGTLGKAPASSAAAALSGGTIAGMQIKASDKAANIEKIMNQTQSLAKVGGGEMKIRLTPEGLGQVQLKVNLQDGKVNVQVSTESKEAKDLIESSLRDLKHNLSSHRVAVDNIKVDVGLQGNSDFSNQGQNFQQGQQGQGDFSRESARQFLQQFRDGNFQQRSGILEAQGTRAYRPMKHEAVELEANVSPRNVSPHKGSGLNLVA